MKKFLAVMMALTVLCGLAACGKKAEEPTTPAGKLVAEFEKQAANEKDPVKLAETLAGNEIFPFMAASMEVEPGFLMGFDADITGFTKGATYGPVISTIPFIGYVFECADEAAAAALRQQLEENANLAWNICTSADESACSVVGNLVMFVMAPAAFEGN